MATSACQVCLDAIEDEEQLLTNVCGKSCSAQICRPCLGRHIQVTLQQFYPGVLPRVRCPICLVAMHLSWWVDRVPADLKEPLTAKYGELCRQACVLTPPCCHKTDYTHLPVLNPDRKSATPLTLLPSQFAKYNRLCKQFWRHKLEPRAVLDYAFNTFGEEKAMVLVNELTLSRIHDPERRATLLLSLMYLRPNTKTNCCGADFCFNCKCRGHHASCVEDFNEVNDLVRCRKCRVLLLKVEGCDAVNCVCGFNMNWTQEQKLRQQYRKGLLPVDIFDIWLAGAWLTFRVRYPYNMIKMREKWLHKRVVEFRPLLHPIFAAYVWRFRLRKMITIQLNAAWEVRRARQIDQHLAVVKGVLRAAVASCIWRWRFRRALIKMEPVMYWKAYKRWHPEEIAAEAEEVNTLFSIGVFDEDE